MHFEKVILYFVGSNVTKFISFESSIRFGVLSYEDQIVFRGYRKAALTRQ